MIIPCESSGTLVHHLHQTGQSSIHNHLAVYLLHPLAADRFFMLEENAEISFVKDASGAVTKLRAQTANEDVTADRLP